MKINTRVFGEIEIDNDKIITLHNGAIGYPELTQFYLIYNEEGETNDGIKWMQSIENPEFALMVVDPLIAMQEYNPAIKSEMLDTIGEYKEDETLVLVTVTAPKEIAEISINLKAPFVINTTTKEGVQIIVENADYPVKFYIYDILQARKKGE